MAWSTTLLQLEIRPELIGPFLPVGSVTRAQRRTCNAPITSALLTFFHVNFSDSNSIGSQTQMWFSPGPKCDLDPGPTPGRQDVLQLSFCLSFLCTTVQPFLTNAFVFFLSLHLPACLFFALGAFLFADDLCSSLFFAPLQIIISICIVLPLDGILRAFPWVISGRAVD